MSRPDRAVFRLPAAALFLPVLLLFCITPLATGAPWWGILFAVPVGALAWVLITRTTATPTGVTAHGLLGSKRMAWTDMEGLEFRDSRWAIAVGTDGRRLRLPMVRPRDLPALTSVSGGSLLLGAEAAAAAEETDGAPGGSRGSAGETAAEPTEGLDQTPGHPRQTPVGPDDAAIGQPDTAIGQPDTADQAQPSSATTSAGSAEQTAIGNLKPVALARSGDEPAQPAPRRS